MNGDDFDASGLRELAHFTLAGAVIFGSDSTFLPSLRTRDEAVGCRTGWCFFAAAIPWGATVAYFTWAG